MKSEDSTRVDRWLWSVRAFKTRSIATEACRSGHVAVNRRVTKPSTPVRVGDLVTIRVDGRDRVLEVARVIENRVGAPIAVGATSTAARPRRINRRGQDCSGIALPAGPPNGIAG
jgi:ribosome-associated heat shock protein Hsp15